MTDTLPTVDDDARVIARRIEQVPTESLLAHPDNPRRGDVPAIVESIERNGFFDPLIVQQSTRFVLSGNHRRLAAIELGMGSVPVVWVDVDDAVARRMLLAANRTNDLASYDVALLTELLAPMADDDGLAGTGYDSDDLADFLAQLDTPDLDGLHDKFGDPQPEDGWAIVSLRCPPDVASALRVALIPLGTNDHERAVQLIERLT